MSWEHEVEWAAQWLWEGIRDEPQGSIVALTGSGISSESGIPVFRGNEGLWRGFRAEDLATPQAFRENPQRVWEWYHWRRELVLAAKPNPAHLALAELEQRGLLSHVITQNVDGLHQKAGSRNVIELHGSIHRARCIECGFRFPLADDAQGIVTCSKCGAAARPDIVWFGEVLPEDAWNAAYYAALACRAMLVIGTSGIVYPAAGLSEIAGGDRPQGPARLVIINPEETGLDRLTEVRLRGRAGEVLPKLAERLLALAEQPERS